MNKKNCLWDNRVELLSLGAKHFFFISNHYEQSMQDQMNSTFSPIFFYENFYYLPVLQLNLSDNISSLYPVNLCEDTQMTYNVWMTYNIFSQQRHENLRSQTWPYLGLNLLSVHISASCTVIDFLNFRNFMTILYLQHFGFISLFWGHEIIFFSLEWPACSIASLGINFLHGESWHSNAKG